MRRWPLRVIFAWRTLPWRPTPANTGFVVPVTRSISALKMAARIHAFAYIVCTIYRIK